MVTRSMYTPEGIALMSKLSKSLDFVPTRRPARSCSSTLSAPTPSSKRRLNMSFMGLGAKREGVSRCLVSCRLFLFYVVCFWVRNLVIVFHVFIFRHYPRMVILNEIIPFQVVYLSFHIANIQPQDILSSYFFKYFSKNRISCCYSTG